MIGAIGHGFIFGEGALDGGPRTATVKDITPVTCSIVEYETLLESINSDSRFALSLVLTLISRSRFAARRMKSLALDTVYQRLRVLMGCEPRIIEITQQEIGEMIGASRDMVTKIFRDPNKGGYIRTARGSVELLKALPQSWKFQGGSLSY